MYNAFIGPEGGAGSEHHNGQCSGCYVASIISVHRSRDNVSHKSGVDMMSDQTLGSECQPQDTKCSQVMVFVLRGSGVEEISALSVL